MRLSVIIPTFNRKQVLLRAIECLFRQEAVQDFEIVLVDDGSTDGTLEAIQNLALHSGCPMQVLAQDHRGPAAARNAALRSAKGELVLFLGDDIFATPDLLSTHLRAHEQHMAKTEAVLGHTRWSPDMRVSALSEYIERSGVQFAYGRIKDPSNVSYEYFYTSNVSLKREFLLECGLFDEDFRWAAYEDVELAYRLQSRCGLRIFYEPQALAFHFHPVSIGQLRARARIKGHAVVMLNRKHPEVFDVDRVVRVFPAYKVLIKRLLFIVLIPLAEAVERLGMKAPLDRMYAWIESFYFYQGIREARQSSG